MSETYSKEGPICPHCGHQHRSSDDPQIYYNEDLCEMECDDCHKPFRVMVYTSTSWSCDKPEALE